MLTQHEVLMIGMGILLLTLCMLGGFYIGKRTGRRRMNALVKKRDGNHSARDFIIQPADDGAMEMRLTPKAWKLLRKGPLEATIAGSKDAMIFRVVIAT